MRKANNASKADKVNQSHNDNLLAGAKLLFFLIVIRVNLEFRLKSFVYTEKRHDDDFENKTKTFRGEVLMRIINTAATKEIY